MRNPTLLDSCPEGGLRPPRDPAVRERTVYLEWIGEGPMEDAALKKIQPCIEDTFGCRTRIRVRKEDFRRAFDSRRRQHSSTAILRGLLKEPPRDAFKVLAVTDRDLFIPVLTFVFGEAQLGGVGAVVSTARLRGDSGGEPYDPGLFASRLLKECLHELGHTFGLTHCTESACFMSRSNTVFDVDRKGTAPCPDCAARLREAAREEGR